MRSSSNTPKLDWKKLAAIEVNRFEHDLLSEQWSIEEISSMIANCFLEAEFNLASIDQNFVKLFRVSQILIKILLEKFVTFKSLEDEICEKRSLSQENQKLRKLVEIYKQAMSNGSSSMFANGLFQCPNCPKAFGDETYLQSHITRRHPDSGLESRSLMPLMRRISQYTSAFQNMTSSTKTIEEMKKELDNIRSQLESTQEELKKEREARVSLESKVTSEFNIKGQKPLDGSCSQSNEVKVPDSLVSSSGKATEANKTLEISIDCGRNVRERDQDLTNLIISHTKEVRSIGNRLEKLIEKLDGCNSIRPRESTQTSVGIIRPPAEPKHFPASAIEQVARIERTKSKDRRMILSELSQQLGAIGLKETDHINSRTFQEALKEVKAKRKKMRTYEKADHLKNVLDYQVRSKNIEKTLALLNNQVTESESISISAEDGTTSIPATRSEVKVEQEKELDEKSKIKSLLILRDKEGRRLSRDGNKVEKKLRFNETRIEISPEHSVDQNEQDLESMENAKKQVYYSHQDEDKSDDESLLAEEMEEVNSGQKKENQKSATEASVVIETTSESHVVSVGDHLKASDLQWFDSDSSNSEEDKTKNSTSKVVTDSNKDNFLDPKMVSVQELTRIIEEQLTSQTNRKGNSAEIVHSERKPTTKFETKSIGTLVYESNSD